MPAFEKTDDTIIRLLARAIETDKAIAEGVQKAGYEDGELATGIIAQAEAIWEVVSEENRRYLAEEEQAEAVRLEIAKGAGDEPTEGDAVRSAGSEWLGVLIGVYMLGLFVYAGVALYSDWRAALESLKTLSGWAFVVTLIAPIVVLAGITELLDKRRRRGTEARRLEFERRLEEWQAQRGVLVERSGIAMRERALEDQRAAVEKLLFERVKDVTRSTVNRRLEPSYEPRLRITKPRGFGEVFDQRFTIQTPARKRLQFMLSNMPGGSIGIAGSRGAGKTTLLKLFCGPKRVIERLNDKPVLGVLVSAPVAYQARDFILYLFAAICQNVIVAEGGKYAVPGIPEEAPVAELLQSSLFRALRPLPPLLAIAGVSLVLLSVIIGAALAALQSPSMPESRPQPAAVAAKEAAPSTTPAVATDSAASRSDAAKPPPAPDSFTSVWARQMKVEPGTLFAWGVSLTVAGLILAEVLGIGARRMFLLALARVLFAMGGRIPFYKRFFIAFLESQTQKERLEAEARPMTPTPPTATAEGERLRVQAETWLKAMKFQQSYTSGWSGALKLPIGLEGGVNRAVTLAQNQLSLPEVVYFLTRFLEEVSRKHQVIIGIDEMDKLASDELAQQFLNDIKSIFGIEQCFYLISVSENAMSNFERRGLPFRDVFDSAFDDFVYVDHLDFNSARELLEQRVVGRPIPFFTMSYCMSGGLARDLIRSFRSVLEVYDPADPAKNGLSAICASVVQSDLKAKIRATITSAKKTRLQPELDRFLEVLHRLELGVGSDSALIEAAGELFAFVGEDNATEPDSAAARIGRSLAKWRERGEGGTAAVMDKERADKLAELRQLAQELATYIQYAVTLRQVFTDNLAEATLSAPPQGGTFDVLAKARQVLGVNPAITRALLKSFREAHDLPAFPQAG